VVVTAALAVALLLLALTAPAGAEAAPQSPAASNAGAQAAAARAGLRPWGVRALQRRLADLGYLPAGGVDGIFGGQTQAAVIAFQKWKGLVRDGIPGPRTRAALSRAKRPEPLTERPGTRVEILLDRQVLLFIRNGWVARTIHVSTGKRGFVTPSGEYTVLRKRRRARSIPYKVWLPWASFIVGGIAIHESANVPVRRASHGCIRVPRYDAAWLFRRTPVGTPVTVLARSR